MNVDTVKTDLLSQLKDGFDPRKFETFILKYFKTLESNDVKVDKTLYYYDMTNHMVRMYIRTKTDTYNLHFNMKTPHIIEINRFGL